MTCSVEYRVIPVRAAGTSSDAKRELNRSSFKSNPDIRLTTGIIVTIWSDN